MYMAGPSDRNTFIKVIEELFKYKDLEIEFARMWKTGKEAVPVVIGALWVIKKALRKYVDKIPSQSASMSPNRLLFWEQLTLSEGFCQ